MIKSRAALTYAEAQTRIDDERLTDDVSAGLRELNRIAKILRLRRAERGALSLASPEVRFEIDTETHDPTDVGMYQVRTESFCRIHAVDATWTCTLHARPLSRHMIQLLMPRVPATWAATC